MNALKKSKVLFILLFLSGIWVSCKKEEKVMPPIQVPFVVVQKSDVPVHREYPAQTFGDLDVDLVARVDGILQGIHFKEGDKVRKGQLLYTIDPIEYDTKVEREKGQVAAFRSSYVNAEEELKRIRPLAEMNAVSKRELDAAVARAKASKSSLESAEASLRNQQIERGYCNIYAPVDGVIGISNARIGDYISRIGNTSHLNTVSKLNEVRVRFAVSEASFLQYQKKFGKTPTTLTDLELILSDGSTYAHKGKMNFSDASVDPTTGTVTFEAQFPNPEGILRSGQFVKIRIVVSTQKDAIVIPQKAITEMQGIYQVYAIDQAKKIQVRVVEVGEKIGTNWIVSKGLESGDRVAIVGTLFVQPGSVVEPIPFAENVEKDVSNQTE
ncbi:RND family efflux transporter MFP subunit [Flavobacterium limnosediminis JC2902]|uniref:RND family efflux transporter MFP subunit n=1 Tax=Flavobacterium limnosediminis JC2902 TaxID=1341181 RepID=V6SUT8_9FLAO|nr:efflux RND transporter periplasmic adaptor subunit [Flavobacterium limnosediminis]ESU29947.1 RND family efflux transporter MFP subunit [Flavobacterium limnosediminis JC2902]